jgi:ABC-type bacteriocin/lantibiotic exporter with double-glycine peptidase domain
MRASLRSLRLAPELADEVASSRTLAEACRRLERGEVVARQVRSSAEDLRNLGGPVLVDTRAGLALLEPDVGRTLRLSRPAGTVPLSPEQAEQIVEATLDAVPPLPASVGTIRRIWLAVTSEPRRILALLVASAAGALCSVACSLAIRAAVDRAIPREGLGLLTGLALMILAASFYQAVVVLVRERLGSMMSGSVTALIRHWNATHLFQLDFTWARRCTVGRHISYLGQCERMTRAVFQFLIVGIVDVTLIGLQSIVLLAWAPTVGALVLAGAFLSVVIAAFSGRPRALLEVAVDKYQAVGTQRMLELLRGIEDVKANGAERWCIDRWFDNFFAQRRARSEHARLSILTDLLGQSYGLVSWTVCLVVGGALLSAGGISMGDLLGIMSLCGGLGQPVRRLCATIADVRSLAAVYEAMKDVADAPVRSLVRPALSVEGAADAVNIRDLWFRYGDDGPWLASGLSACLGRGQHLVIAGPSGVGKTTILRLMTGLLAPTRGCVEIYGRRSTDGHDAFVYLPQDAALWSGLSIRENLMVFSHGASRARLLAVAASTGLSEVVARLPLSYETTVGDARSFLSGGERQLVLLTACLASDAPLLFLDEPFAHMDMPTQMKLRDSDLFVGRTVVLVGHDLVTEGLARSALNIDVGRINANTLVG